MADLREFRIFLALTLSIFFSLFSFSGLIASKGSIVFLSTRLSITY